MALGKAKMKKSVGRFFRIPFSCSRNKIDFGVVFGWILGGFGLHFGRFFGAKSEKVAFQSGLKSKAKDKTKNKGATGLNLGWLGWDGAW